MNKILAGFVWLVACLVVADYAEACGRCGLLERQCSFVKQVAIKAVSVPYAYPQQAPVTQITNIFPQGSTLYGYQQAAGYSSVSAASQLYGVNPSLALETASRVADRGLTSLTAAIELGHQNNMGLVELAKMQAAQEHLRIALSSSEQRQSLNSSVSLRITQGAGGVKVETIDETGGQNSPAGGKGDHGGNGGGGGDSGGLPLPPGQDDLAAAPQAFGACVRCHSGAVPKSGFSLDNDWFSAEAITASIRAISSGAMPPQETNLVLSPQDKGDIMAFLLSRERK